MPRGRPLYIGLAIACVIAGFFMAGYWVSRSESMPDFAAIHNFQRRQQVFIAFLLPKLQQADRLLLWQRRNIQQMHDYWLRNHYLGNSARQWIIHIAKRYKVPVAIDNMSFWSMLLSRVDIIPAGLALAQAANESAWGMSRFAQQGNNLFGQWCYQAGCGLVPTGRPAGATYEVKKFHSTYDAVLAYLYNLNTNAAYSHLRQIRQQLREKGLPLSSVQLAAGLDRYSQKGKVYAALIQSIIVQYHLKQYD